MWNTDIVTVGKKLMHVYESYCAPVCRQFGINQSTLDILLFLANHPKLNTAKDICEIRGMKKGIVSVTLEHMERDGYVKRGEDPKDRRVQRLYLTGQCQEMISKGQRQQKKFLERMTSVLSKEEMETLKKLTGKLKKQIDKMEKEL